MGHGSRDQVRKLHINRQTVMFTQPRVTHQEIRSGNYTLTDSITDEAKHSEEVYFMTVLCQVFYMLSVLFTIPMMHFTEIFCQSSCVFCVFVCVCVHVCMCACMCMCVVCSGVWACICAFKKKSSCHYNKAEPFLFIKITDYTYNKETIQCLLCQEKKLQSIVFQFQCHH